MRTRLVLLVTILAASTAHAQVGRGSNYGLGQPDGWFSFGVGYVNGWGENNGTQVWQFGDGPQYQASLEKAMSSGLSFGLAATTARLPVHVSDVGLDVDADATVSQGFATAHLASGSQFHSALDLRAGATVYSAFANRVPGVSSGVSSTGTDFTFAFAYGFGYNFNSKFSVDVVQDHTTIVHNDNGANPTGNHSAGMFTTRIIARMGLGGR